MLLFLASLQLKTEIFGSLSTVPGTWYTRYRDACNMGPI